LFLREVSIQVVAVDHLLLVSKHILCRYKQKDGMRQLVVQKLKEEKSWLVPVTAMSDDAGAWASGLAPLLIKQ
jgi:hypothetical protein